MVGVANLAVVFARRTSGCTQRPAWMILKPKQMTTFEPERSAREFINLNPIEAVKKSISIRATGLLALGLLAFGGCSQQEQSSSSSNSSYSSATQSPATNQATSSATQGGVNAMATISPTKDHQAKGTVNFTKEADGVRVVADLSGLTPGSHGFHIHEKGDCSAPDASSAGGHYNPTGMPHGGPDAAKHHVGDLGNIEADQSGKAHLDRVFSFLSLSGTNSIVGRAVIVHAGKDDLTSQPSGAAGARAGCGVINESGS